MSAAPTPEPAVEEEFDAVVVGAGVGGVYAVYKLRETGLRVLGVDGAGGFGGVWYHNRYPGARVDVDSLDYCYYFDQDLYREWKWSERYATQPELLRYVNHVADRFDLRKDFVFDTWVTGARWDAVRHRYLVTTDTGRAIATRFLVMATGNLSRSRDLDFPGLERYRGEWVQTSHWPDRDVPLAGRRVGVVGTGSSGVQTIGAIAGEVGELYVFQRSPNFSIPAHNGPLDEKLWAEICADVPGHRRRMMFEHPGASHLKFGLKPTSELTDEEVLQLIERQYGRGGHEFATMFPNQGRDREANDIIAEYVRRRIRSIVEDPEVAEALCPDDHPIGTRRLVLDTGYYESFNLPHVHLVNLKKEPLETITETGIRTSEREYELDLIILANGFRPFVGSLADAHVSNEHGEQVTDGWQRGARTFLGLMTDRFPNLFFLTGPGSPSVLANMTLGNEFHVDWVARLIEHMKNIGATAVEPTPEAVDEWTDHVQEVARPMLRYWTKNYMVHVNEDDGSRVFLPYIGGHHEYARRATEVADAGFPGLKFE